MGGIRGFLIGIANFILFLLVVVAPIIAFVIAGFTMGFGGFNWMSGVGAGVITFIAMLPLAATIAVFLDIRQQLVTINQTMRASAVASAPPPVAIVTPGVDDGVAPVDEFVTGFAPGTSAKVIEVTGWFLRNHGRRLTLAEAEELVAAQGAGRFLTKAKELDSRGR